MMSCIPDSPSSSSKKRKEAPTKCSSSTRTTMMDTSSVEEEKEPSPSPSPSSSHAPKIRVGNRNLTLHSDLVEMRDSTPEFQSGRFDLLRQRLDADGFLFIRGVIPKETVAAARKKMLTHLLAKGAIREGTDWTQGLIEFQSVWDAKNKNAAAKKKMKAAAEATSTNGGGMMSMMAAASSTCSSSKKMIPGWTVDAESGGIIGGREPDSEIAGWFEIGNSKELVDVYNGAALRTFYQRLFEQDDDYRSRPQLAQANLPSFSSLPSCTWLRAKGPGEVTAEHADYYYFYKNTHIFRDYWKVDDEEDETTKKLKAVAAASSSTSSSTSSKKSSSATMSDEERQTCQICHDPKDPDSTLICDLCDHGYHMDCLKPAMTWSPSDEQEWHCYKCSNLPMNYWTCWTTMTDISGQDGRLALVAGSHRLIGYEDPVREDLLPRDYTKSFEQKSIWQTPSKICMGDIILFNIKTIHAATKNAGEKFRLSLDTRVTTCKGKEYCEENGLKSLDSIPETKMKQDVVMTDSSSSRKSSVKGSGVKKGGTISSFYPSQKKRKI